MVNKWFKIFSILFSIIGLALTILSIIIVVNSKNLINIPGFENIVEVMSASGFTYILVGLALCITNLLSYFLIVHGESVGVIRRWYFIPALIGSLFSIATVIGIVYFIIVLVSLFKSDVTHYEEDEARKYIIITSIIFFVIGIAGLVVPMVVLFNPALMSLLMFFGMCFTCFSLSVAMYFICGPQSRFNILIKIITLISELGILTGLYFLFRAILINNVERFNGDWPTIHNALIVAISIAALIDIAYFVFGLRNKEYDAYVNMQQASIAIALIVLIVANFVALHWWLIIEAVLWILSFILIGYFACFCAAVSGGGGGGGGSPRYKETKVIKTESGRTIDVSYEGNGNYVDNDGGHWHSNDHETFTKK